MSGFPDDIPINPHIAQHLQSVDVVGSAAKADDVVNPTSEQYALQHGDGCIIVGTRSTVDRDFNIGVVLDPADHAKLFPDWEERIFKGYLLLGWKSTDDPIGDLGWFSRSKLMRVEPERYKELVGYLDGDGLPDEIPDWLKERFYAYSEDISLTNVTKDGDRLIPVLTSCGLCSSREVELHVNYTVAIKARASEVIKGGVKSFVFQGEPSTEDANSAHLHCKVCGAKGELSSDELGVVLGMAHMGDRD
jgi:hypothetical protein